MTRLAKKFRRTPKIVAHIRMSLYQLRYRGNLVRNVKRDERRYYEELVEYSKKNLMLFPYHLSDVVIKGLRLVSVRFKVLPYNMVGQKHEPNIYKDNKP
jgi:hypothetical protein